MTSWHDVLDVLGRRREARREAALVRLSIATRELEAAHGELVAAQGEIDRVRRRQLQLQGGIGLAEDAAWQRALLASCDALLARCQSLREQAQAHCAAALEHHAQAKAELARTERALMRTAELRDTADALDRQAERRAEQAQDDDLAAAMVAYAGAGSLVH
jgi:hypothetical protein